MLVCPHELHATRVSALQTWKFIVIIIGHGECCRPLRRLGWAAALVAEGWRLCIYLLVRLQAVARLDLVEVLSNAVDV